MNLFTRPQERPGSQVSRHPTISSTNEKFTLILFSAMRLTGNSAVAIMYSGLSTKAAAAAIDEELMFAAEKETSQVYRWIWTEIVTFMHCQLTRAIQIAMVELLLEKWESKSSTTTPEVDEFWVD
jgi:hypothetical protein